MSVFNIYNGTLFSLIQWFRVMIVRRLVFDLVNTKKAHILSVCDQPYHTNVKKLKGGGLKFAELCIEHYTCIF